MLNRFSKNLLHILLIVSLLSSQQAYGEIEQPTNEVASSTFSYVSNKNSNSENPLIEEEFGANVVTGPYYEDSSILSFQLGGIKGELFFKALNEERVLRSLPEEDFLGLEHQKDQLNYISPKIDLELHPDFFVSVQNRYHKLLRHQESSDQKSIQANAIASAKSDKVLQNLNFLLRWGTSVFFFSVITGPQNLDLLAIATISMMATFFYNNMMPFYESIIAKGGKAIRSVPLYALKAGHKIGNQVPFLSSYSNSFFSWAENVYQEKFVDSETWKYASQLGTAFCISSVFVIAYSIVLNLADIGFAESIKHSGSSLVEFGGRFWEIDAWKFANGFHLNSFLNALNSDITNFQFDKFLEFLGNQPILLKTMIFTLYGEIWTIYRMKYRSQQSDQTKANRLGWMLGAMFALLAPIIHRSSNVLLGQATDPLSISGLVLASSIAITGLAYVFGNGPLYVKRIQDYLSTKKNQSLTSFAKLKKQLAKYMRAGIFAFNDLVNWSSVPAANYKSHSVSYSTIAKYPKHEESSTASYCRSVFKALSR